MRKTQLTVIIGVVLLLAFSLTALAVHSAKTNSSNHSTVAVQTTSNPDYFPLNPGSYWEYSFHSREADGSNIVTNDQKIRMEVISKTKDGEYYLFQIKGDPIYFSPEGHFGLAVDIKSQKVYYLDDNRLQRLTKSETFKSDSIPDFSNILFEFPLRDGQTYGADVPGRTDNMYMYAVKRDGNWHGYMAKDRKKTLPQYQISYACTADVLTYTFVPHLGITGVSYHHNGTVIDYDIKLTSYELR